MCAAGSELEVSDSLQLSSALTTTTRTSLTPVTTMSWSPDALLSLQRAIKSKTQVKFTDAASNPVASLPAATHIQLQHGPLPKSAPTRLRKPGGSASDPPDSPEEFFSLCAVYLAWANRDASGAEYLRQARENGLGAGGFVSVTERKSVVDWLEGRIPHLDNIVSLPCELREVARLDL